MKGHASDDGPAAGDRNVEPLDEADGAFDPPRSARSRWVMTALFGGIAGLLALDLTDDYLSGTSVAHVAAEAGVLALALTGLVVLWAEVLATRRRSRALSRHLAVARADAARWRSEAQTALQGLGEAIDRQFAAWELSPAEREVGLLLLKGVPLRQIAELRGTSERTVRQQSLAVYRKAQVAGRAELSAFFLEDLLLPPLRPAG